MKHVITRHDNRIEIQLTGIGDDSKFFGSVDSCAPVEDTCGPEKYQTLDSLATHPFSDGVRFELRARADAQLDLDEAEQCLDNAMGRIMEKREEAYA
ncbi:MAG: hypothetical protein KF749_13115 [Bacteroidetes bacterium]|nr:hypothetical protein [Bacteroidota bacterium]MCW5894364.1 hypothetical protein [Bacteroidota bacterium]